jgi:hypothetical protein
MATSGYPPHGVPPPGFPPGYPQQPYYAPPQPQGNGMAIAGMVLGILALVLFWIPFLNWLLALLGIVFAALGLARAGKVQGTGKVMAITGLVCGVLGAAIGAVFWVWVVREVDHAVGRKLRAVDREIAHERVSRLAFEAFPMWSSRHPDKACPASIDELLEEGSTYDRLDPWGRAYRMRCGSDLPPGAKAIAISSAGPDRIDDTEDDIQSW